MRDIVAIVLSAMLIGGTGVAHAAASNASETKAVDEITKSQDATHTDPVLDAIEKCGVDWNVWLNERKRADERAQVTRAKFTRLDYRCRMYRCLGDALGQAVRRSGSCTID